MSCNRFVTRRLFLAVAAISAIAPSIVLSETAPAVPSAPPATIYLIRHAEKLTDGREDLSVQGFRRAAFLPQLFVAEPGVTRALLPKPDFLVATAPSKHSNRPFETVMPLSSALNLPISNAISNDDYPQLAAELLSEKYAGKIVLVSWHHGNLPKLAMALGATPPYAKWPETQFDRIWRIEYAGGKATLTDLPQGLFPGDSK